MTDIDNNNILVNDNNNLINSNNILVNNNNIPVNDNNNLINSDNILVNNNNIPVNSNNNLINSNNNLGIDILDNPNNNGGDNEDFTNDEVTSYEENDYTTNLWTLIEDAMVKGNFQDLEYGLTSMQEILTEPTDIEQSLIYVLNLAFRHGHADAIPMIIAVWAAANVDEDYAPTATMVFLYKDLLPGFFPFYAKVFTEWTYEWHMTNLLVLNNDEGTQMACERIHQAYGDQPLEVYKNVLYEVRLRKDGLLPYNVYIEEFIGNIMSLSKNGEYAEIPEWIIYIEGEIPSHEQWVETLPILGDVDFVIPNADEAAQLIIDNLKIQNNIPPEAESQAYDDLYATLSGASLKTRIALIAPFVKVPNELRLFDDEEMFRILGPSFPLAGDNYLDSRSQNPCARFGGCRAMLCFEYENNDGYGEVLLEDVDSTGLYAMLEWYTGACDFCRKKIRAKHHAVRMPMDTGGWLGCYCSFKCIRNDIVKPNPIREPLVDIFENQYRKYGIYDRTWPNFNPNQESNPLFSDIQDSGTFSKILRSVEAGNQGLVYMPIFQTAQNQTKTAIELSTERTEIQEIPMEIPIETLKILPQ